jgi:hypothetical protein
VAEAAELAALLSRDGTPAVSVAWSYLAGAAPPLHAAHHGNGCHAVRGGLGDLGRQAEKFRRPP